MLDVVLVTLIAPVARPGRKSSGGEALGYGAALGSAVAAAVRQPHAAAVPGQADACRAAHCLPLFSPAPPLPTAGKAGGLRAFLGTLPSAVFEASSPGRRFGLGQRAATYVKLGLEYSLGEPFSTPAPGSADARAAAGEGRGAGQRAGQRVGPDSVATCCKAPLPTAPPAPPCRPPRPAAGITCGFIGQGVANSIMLLKRKMHGEKASAAWGRGGTAGGLAWGACCRWGSQR